MSNQSTLDVRHEAAIRSIDQAQTSDLHTQWRADMRKREIAHNAWRGCLGLAMFSDATGGAHVINHGDACLLPNDSVRWAAIRDVPPNHYRANALMDRQGVDLASVTQAKLRYGMPCIDFTEEARRSWNMRFVPFDRHLDRDDPELAYESAGYTLNPRINGEEFALLNRVNDEMTRFAAFARGKDGRRIVDNGWWRVGGGGRCSVAGAAAVTPVRPRRWFPVPYLAFDVARFAELFWDATEAQSEGAALPCPTCGDYIDAAVFQTEPERYAVQLFEDGNFVAKCPTCRNRRKWHVEDAVPARTVRNFPAEFRRRFVRAVAEGLLLRSVGPTTYCGVAEQTRSARSKDLLDGESLRIELVPHEFRSDVDKRRFRVYLPTSAQVTAKIGQHLDAGEQWCTVVPVVPKAWLAKGSEYRWLDLGDVFGGRFYANAMTLVWFADQAVRDVSLPEQFLMPADLVTFAIAKHQPRGLWWDLWPARDYIGEDGTAVFPPMPLDDWAELQFNMPGDVLLDASVVGPQFDFSFTQEEWAAKQRSTPQLPPPLPKHVERAKPKAKAVVTPKPAVKAVKPVKVKAVKPEPRPAAPAVQRYATIAHCVLDLLGVAGGKAVLEHFDEEELRKAVFKAKTRDDKRLVLLGFAHREYAERTALAELTIPSDVIPDDGNGLDGLAVVAEQPVVATLPPPPEDPPQPALPPTLPRQRVGILGRLAQMFRGS